MSIKNRNRFQRVVSDYVSLAVMDNINRANARDLARLFDLVENCSV